MAKFNRAVVNILDEDEDDVEFMSQLEAAEAQALSFSSSSKRRRFTTPLSSSPSPSPAALINSRSVKVKLEERENEKPSSSSSSLSSEGAYTAALKGSKSLTWQQQQQQQQQSQLSSTSASTTRSVSGGACFKCGKDGHWSRDCDQSSSLDVEKSCPCGLGNCLLLTANTERNRGRKFFRCPLRQENGGCGFFEWCDEPSGNHISAGERTWKSGGQQQFNQHPANQGRSSGFTQSAWNGGTASANFGYGAATTAAQKFETTENKSYGMTRPGSSPCFKCGKEGHWARDCPTPNSNSSTTVGSMREKSSSSDNNACYKCGQSGHWAKDCSQRPQTTKLRSW